MLFLFIDNSCTYSQSIEYLSPRRGAEYISPKTNIIIRPGQTLDRSSINTSDLLSVDGSSSGRHYGKIVLSDDEKTLIFQPEKDFRLSEVITVKLQNGLKTVEGNNVDPLSFSFKIIPALSQKQKTSLSLIPGSGRSFDFNSSWMQEENSRQQFRKISDNLPSDYPQYRINVYDNPSPDALFLSANALMPIPIYLLILEDSSKPIFYRRMTLPCQDFKMQPNGLLTYFDLIPNCFIALDSSYTVVDSFRCGNGYTTDFHDVQILPNGHALLMTTDSRIIDMSQYVPNGNTNANVTGLIIQELDKSKQVVFEWRSWDHFKITDAIGVDFTANGFEYVHGNSLDYDLDGNIIVSCRVMCEVTKINRRTGDIIWRFGGKNTQFTIINDTIPFSYQHDARLLPNGHITLYDNGNLRNPIYSRAIEYELNENSKTATVVWQFDNNYNSSGEIFGNVQRLANGNTLIGWGHTTPCVTEVTPDGKKVFELQFLDIDIQSYRAFKFPWKTNVTSVREQPEKYSLGQNYPNPISSRVGLNTITQIRFSLSKREHVFLKIYNVFGQELITLIDEVKDTGNHVLSVDTGSFASGVYYYRIMTPTFSQTRKMIVNK